MAETNRGRLWPILSTLPDLFVNVTQAVKWVQETGIGYHYQTMWHDVRSAFDTFQKAPLQEAYGFDDYLPQNLFIEKDFRSPQSYYYYGTTTFRDPSTGELFDRSYSLYADTSLTDRELTDFVYNQESMKIEEYGKNWEVVAFKSEQRFHRWGASRSQGYRAIS